MHVFRLKCTKFDFDCVSAQTPLLELTALSDSLTHLGGSYFLLLMVGEAKAGECSVPRKEILATVLSVYSDCCFCDLLFCAAHVANKDLYYRLVH